MSGCCVGHWFAAGRVWPGVSRGLCGCPWLGLLVLGPLLPCGLAQYVLGVAVHQATFLGSQVPGPVWGPGPPVGLMCRTVHVPQVCGVSEEGNSGRRARAPLKGVFRGQSTAQPAEPWQPG